MYRYEQFSLELLKKKKERRIVRIIEKDHGIERKRRGTKKKKQQSPNIKNGGTETEVCGISQVAPP